MRNRILVIDDDKDFTLCLKVFLGSRGYSVIEANSAVEGGLCLGAEKPDLIIMDLRMSGIDGFEACGVIRKNPRTMDIPILVVSGMDYEECARKSLEAGANGYLSKPMNHDDLIKEIERLLKIEPARDEKKNTDH
jgi:CheY-like chemotaxis protein